MDLVRFRFFDDQQSSLTNSTINEKVTFYSQTTTGFECSLLNLYIFRTKLVKTAQKEYENTKIRADTISYCFEVFFFYKLIYRENLK